jgi:putative addiction module antidote
MFIWRLTFETAQGCSKQKAPAIITNVLTAGYAMTTLKITQIGNSLGLILPKEILARLKLQKGDAVFITDTPDGVALTPYDPEVAEQLSMGNEFMKEYRDTFRELAK